MAVGTVTAVCGDEVLAFGHPMSFTGPSTLTMHPADAVFIALHGRYEVQILGDFGKAPAKGGAGALYSQKPPMVNASKPAGEWQTMDKAALKLSGARAVLAVESQHQLIALDNAADCFIPADFPAVGGAHKPGTGTSRRHAPQPQSTTRVAHELVHVSNAGVPEAVALAPRLVFVKAGQIALKPVAARPSL